MEKKPLFTGKAGTAVSVVAGVIAVAMTSYIVYLNVSKNHRTFKVDGVRVICRADTEQWCPSREEFRAFLGWVTGPFEEHMADPMEALQGIEYRIEPIPMRFPGAPDECPDPSHPPEDPRQIDGRPCYAWGLSWPWHKDPYSRIYGPYAVQVGTGGHEIRMHLMHFLFPDQPESRDIQWMRENGIYEADRNDQQSDP